MNQVDRLLIKFETDGEGRVRASLGGVSQELGQIDRQGSLATATIGKMGGALAGLVGVGALTQIAQGILDATVNFQRLQAALTTVTGSAAAAGTAFESLRRFAATTPFQLNEVVDAFIKLKARGLDPSEAALRSYGNTAGATGKALDQVIEAVGDAATGEFERLKEFGVVARTQGDQIKFTFQGVTTTVKRDAAEIEGYLRSLGDVQFAGGMERQSATLGGAFSNAQDAAENLASSIGNVLSPMLLQMARDATEAADKTALAVRWMERMIGLDAQAGNSSGSGLFDKILRVTPALASTMAAIDAMAASQLDAETAVGKHELKVEALNEAYSVLVGRIARSKELLADGFVLPAIKESEAAKLQEYEASLADIGAQIAALADQHPAILAVEEAFAKMGETGKAAEDQISDATQKVIDKLRDQAATYGLSKSAVLEYEKAQAVAAQTTQAGKDALTEQYDALIKKVKAEEDAAAAVTARASSDKAAAVAAKERAKAEREAADVIARMAAEFDAADAAAEQFEATIEALLDPFAALTREYEAHRLALEEELRLSAGNAEAQAEVAEALRVLEARYKANRTAIEAQHRPVEALLDDLEFEAKLIGLSNVERQKAILLRGLEAEATAEQQRQLTELLRTREADAATEEMAQRSADAFADAMRSAFASLRKDGGDLGKAIGDSLQASLDDALDQNLNKFANELSNLMQGTGGATTQSVTAAGTDAALGAVASYGSSYVGGTSSMGQSVVGGAAAGAAYGTMIMPGIGTIVGAILGAIIGFIAYQDPILEVSSSQSGINHGRVEGRTTSAFGEIFVGKDDLTLAGNMQSQELAERIADFDNAIASFLTGAEIQAAKDALADFDFNQRGHGLGPAEVLTARFNEVINAVQPAWFNFLNSITDLQQRVEAFQGLRAMASQMEPLEALIESIDGDPFEQLRFAVHNLQTAVDEALSSFDAAIVARDPVAIAESSAQLSQAIMRRYQAELDMIYKLADALAAVEERTRAFNFDIAQRIAGVGGSQGAVTAVALNNVNATRINVDTAANAEAALAHLDQFIASVDQWLQSARAEVDIWHAEQQALLAERLSALEAEAGAINAAAAARAQAMAQYQAEINAAQQAALDAERQRLQALLAIAQEWVGVLEAAQSLIDELTLGSANPLSGQARLNMYDVQLAQLRERMAGASEGEQAGIAAQITALLNERLQLAQTLYDRPSGEYLAIYNETLRELGEIRDAAVDPAARALELQAELNALQQGTTDAVISFAGQSASYTDAEMARLAEIELEREAIAEAQRLLDLEQAERLAAIDDQARAYYEWAQGEGQRLLAEQNADILAALELITGGIPVPEYVVGLQERTADALEHIRDSMADFLAMVEAAVRGGSGIPGPGRPGEPPRDGIPGGGGTPGTASVVVQLGDIVVQGGGDPAAIGAAIVAAIEQSGPAIARVLTPHLRVA